MLQPKKTKFRKQQKGRNRGVASRGNKVSFGEFGLRATSRGRINARQIENKGHGRFRLTPVAAGASHLHRSPGQRSPPRRRALASGPLLRPE